MMQLINELDGKSTKQNLGQSSSYISKEIGERADLRGKRT